jgi:hypothetical protein
MLSHRRPILAALVVVAALAAAGCGPGATTAVPAASATAASASAGAPGGNVDFAAIQQCLTAAGITSPSGGSFAIPSGGSFALPSGGVPQRPSGSFAPPSGGFQGGGLNDPATLAALKACGITLPAAPSNP